MPSSFNAQPIFASGPHRFHLLPRGLQVIPIFALDGISPGSVALGALELSIEVRGRLIAASDPALDNLLNPILALLTFPATKADLIDHHGRTYEDMSFIRFEPTSEGRTDRARQVSLPYTARFTRFLSDT